MPVVPTHEAATSSPRRRRIAQASLAAVAVIGSVALAGTTAAADPPAGPKPTIRRHELHIVGTGRADVVALRLSPTDATRLEVDFGNDGRADFAFARDRFDRITITLLGGDDTIAIDEANGVFTDTEVTSIDAGGGADTVSAGSGAERLFGGRGDDVVDGGGGNDAAWLGRGNDRFQWDPGDGNDIVEGQADHDRLVFNGSNSNERFEAAPNGDRVRFTLDVGAVVMDLDDVEEMDLDTLDGRDTLVVRALDGTDLTELNTDLEAAEDSGVGDAQTDFITVFGTEGDDLVSVSGSAGSATVTGLVPTVNITHAVLPDVMQVLGVGGNDTIDASGLAADAIGYGTSGADGNDTLLGGAGADSLDGGNGTDFLDGGRGDDSVFMGPGDDVFQWDPGEGSDLVGGEDGHDTMLFNGSDQDEAFAAAADGFGGATLTRDIGNITMSFDRIEQLDLDALGGSDTVLVDDLSDFRGTGLEAINADLEGVKDAGTGDGRTDTVTATGSNGDDVVLVTGDAGAATVSGLATAINVTTAEPIDRLSVNGLDGADAIDSTGLVAGIVAFLADGGVGDDTMLGGAGDEVFLGGDGSDVIFAGSGNNVALGGDGDDVLRGEEGDDVLDGGAGDDILIGGAGDDVLLNGEVVFDE